MAWHSVAPSVPEKFVPATQASHSRSATVEPGVDWPKLAEHVRRELPLSLRAKHLLRMRRGSRT